MTKRESRSLARGAAALALLAALAVASAPRPALGQAGSDPDPAGLGDRGVVAREQALRDLTNPFTVMCVACHPDDEDGATLTVERRKHGARTVTLFATSGEGGQNAVGPELYGELGRIRERETLEASAIQGSEPYFLRLADFGFSKSGDEAMRIWEEQMGGHERLLEQFVAAIRALKPDAIITNHDTKTGHGQHQATGRLLVEAFDAAGDAKRFPAAGAAWQPQALYVRAPRDSKEGTEVVSDLYDPVRGLTYREQAFRALLRHATQGPWRLEFLPKSARYLAAKGAPSGAAAGLGSPLTAGLALPPGAFYVAHDTAGGPAQVGTLLEEAMRSERVDERYRAEIAAGLLALGGVDVRLELAPETGVVGAPAAARLVVSNGGSAPVRVVERYLTSRHVAAAERNASADAAAVAPGATAEFVEPLDTTTLLGEPPPQGFASGFGPLSAARDPGGPFYVAEKVTGFVAVDVGRMRVPVELTRFLYLEPPVRATAQVRRGGSAEEVVVRVHNVSAVPLDVSVARPGGPARDEAGGSARRTAAPGAEVELVAADDVGTVYVAAAGPNPEWSPRAAWRVLRYPRAEVAPGLRVGYVRSYDFTLPEALEHLGVEHREILPEALAGADLSAFDTIVVDNRAYLKHPELARHNARLLEFVRDGGTLVVFYHKTGEYDPAALAPYPFEIGRGRVTDENAPVDVLVPAHPIFTTPNAITAADFAGWVQERGLYFPSKWAPEYTPLLSSHDPGEAPLAGGLLVAPYGKGTFVYTSYVWYRQLRGIVPGGYRLFANMISLGRRDQGSGVRGQGPSRAVRD